MNMNIPTSKNVTLQEKSNTPLLLLGIVFILTIGTSLLPASWFGIEQQTRQYEPLNLGNLAQPENLANDTDQDGAISWGELIASSLSLTPEDTSAVFEADMKGIAILNDPNNLTASFTKNAYIASTALQQSGIFDEASKQEVFGQLLSEEGQKVSATIYTSSDVRLTTDERATIKKYGNAVATILNGLVTKETIAKDLASISGYLQTADESYLLPLATDVERVALATKKLLALDVPRSALPYHLTTLNRVSEYSNTLANLATANTDAIRATVALKKYEGVTAATIRIYPMLGDYFNLKNVTFTSTEPGYIYIVGYTGITH